MPAKNYFFNTIFSTYYFLKLHLLVHHFSKMKSQKESQNSKTQCFSYYFCIMTEWSGSIPLTSGSGSGSWRPNRIRNTGNKYWRFCYLKVFGLSGLGQGLYGPKAVDDVPGLAEVDLVKRAPDLVLHVLHQSAFTKKTLKSRPEKTLFQWTMIIIQPLLKGIQDNETTELRLLLIFTWLYKAFKCVYC